MTILAWVAVACGVLVILIGAIGLLLARGPFDRLHMGGPAVVLGAPAIAVGLAIGDGPTSGLALRGALIAALLLVTGPVLGHAIARAERLRDTAKPDARPGDGGGPA